MPRSRKNTGLIGLLAAVCLALFPGGALLATNDNNPGIKKVVFEVGELACGAGANILTMSVKATKDGKSVPVFADHGTVSGETFSISREDIIQSGGGERKCHVTFTAEGQTRTVVLLVKNRNLTEFWPCAIWVRMQTINYTDARNQLAGLMEAASRDREPITITRNGTGVVVLLAIEEYEAMEETLHLHSTRENAAQIQQSLADYAAGRIQPGELCD